MLDLKSLRSKLMFIAILITLTAAAAATHMAGAAERTAPHTITWHFDSLTSIGGLHPQVIGHPRVVQTPYGKAIHFNGVDDALILPQHPLAGASTYTWEVIFHPDGGAFAQRFFHLQEQDPETHQDTTNRMLFEIRVMHGQWCLDSFASSGADHRTLLNCKLLHPLGKWYVVTAVYDGKDLHNYVDGQLQGEGPLNLKPQLPGRSSVGMRINHKFFFNGDILMARMTPRALPPSEFLKLPAKLNSLSGK